MNFKLAGVFVAAPLLAACASMGPGSSSAPSAPSGPIALGANPVQACAALASGIGAAAIGLPTRGATIDSSVIVAASPVSVAPGGPTPSARVNPETPSNCKVLGRILPVDPAAPPIVFQVNLPLNWNGRSVQYGGGGFNGVLINGLALVPSGRWDHPSPLAQGFVTYGTDSGHQNKPGEAPQAFAANEEAFVNFAHASYKKVRDVAVALTQRAYGRAPYKIYFVGSSEGGREGLTMAQRYPNDFDGIFSRVPVINWTALMHAYIPLGLALQGDGWLPRQKVELVHKAVLAACDELDGVADGLIANPVACKARFKVASMQCSGTDAPGCLTAPQVKAVQILHAPHTLPFALANGVTQYPGWGVSGEGAAGSGPLGGWTSWTTGDTAPTQPAKPDNSRGWFFGSGAIGHIFARNTQLTQLIQLTQLELANYRPEQHRQRVLEVSALMDSTNPDLGAFQARGGKLIMLENMADYAQSPYAGIGYYESVVKKMGSDSADKFIRLYTAPGVDHVGNGAPGNFDVVGTLVKWTEKGDAPRNLTVVEQELAAPAFKTLRELPLCEWPLWPKYSGGDATRPLSFQCSK